MNAPRKLYKCIGSAQGSASFHIENIGTYLNTPCLLLQFLGISLEKDLKNTPKTDQIKVTF
jgi:hypothetical protein